MIRRKLETWSSDSCRLSHAEAAAVEASGLVDVVAEPTPELWKLVADARVGVAVGEAWEIQVRPRIGVPELLFLLSYAIDPKGWHDDEVAFAATDDLFDAVAHGFARQAGRVLEQGLLRGYVTVDDRLPYVRGRIRFADQITRAALPIPLEVSYEEFTIDVPENRLLLAAANALLRLPRVPELARRRLLSIRATLDGVAPLDRREAVELPAFTRLNGRYRSVLNLAVLILRARSLRSTRGTLMATTFVFDMNRVFEDFLSVALREALGPFGGSVRLQGVDHLDHDGKVDIRPDIRWVRDGCAIAVIDAKHKRLAAGGPPAADVYQMLAYCTAMGLPLGYLVYANDPDVVSGDLRVRNSDCEVRIRTVDLADRPQAVLRAVDNLASEIASGAVPT